MKINLENLNMDLRGGEGNTCQIETFRDPGSWGTLLLYTLIFIELS